MAQRMTPAQLQALLRQEEARRRRELEKYNQAVRQHNQKVDQQIRAHNEAVRRHNQEVERQQRAQNEAIRRHNQEVERQYKAQVTAVNNYNRDVARYNQELQRKINQYNQQVRAQNAKERANREALQRQISALRNQPVIARYENVRASTYELYDQFSRIQQSPSDTVRNNLVELSERESRNSVSMMNALLSDNEIEEATEAPQDGSGIETCLSVISEDLCNRWKGAVFSLNPANPDAARHFCTSVREVFTEILEKTAPDRDVLSSDPDCQRTQQGKPTRKSKIIYLLKQKGVSDNDLSSFIEADIKNIVDLFYVFNEATHGEAGRHAFSKLQSIRRRVEDGIMFLASVAI